MRSRGSVRNPAYGRRRGETDVAVLAYRQAGVRRSLRPACNNLAQTRVIARMSRGFPAYSGVGQRGRTSPRLHVHTRSTHRYVATHAHRQIGSQATRTRKSTDYTDATQMYRRSDLVILEGPAAASVRMHGRLFPSAWTRTSASSSRDHYRSPPRRADDDHAVDGSIVP